MNPSGLPPGRRPVPDADSGAPGGPSEPRPSLVIGAAGDSAIATLVERGTRFAPVVPVGDRRAETVGRPWPTWPPAFPGRSRGR